jgi:hypothetical protein
MMRYCALQSSEASVQNRSHRASQSINLRRGDFEPVAPQRLRNRLARFLPGSTGWPRLGPKSDRRLLSGRGQPSNGARRRAQRSAERAMRSVTTLIEGGVSRRVSSLPEPPKRSDRGMKRPFARKSHSKGPGFLSRDPIGKWVEWTCRQIKLRSDKKDLCDISAMHAQHHRDETGIHFSWVRGNGRRLSAFLRRGRFE